jgi:hypothetical protein
MMFKKYIKIALRNSEKQEGYSFIDMAGLAKPVDSLRYE